MADEATQRDRSTVSVEEQLSTLQPQLQAILGRLSRIEQRLRTSEQRSRTAEARLSEAEEQLFELQEAVYTIKAERRGGTTAEDAGPTDRSWTAIEDRINELRGKLRAGTADKSLTPKSEAPAVKHVLNTEDKIVELREKLHTTALDLEETKRSLSDARKEIQDQRQLNARRQSVQNLPESSEPASESAEHVVQTQNLTALDTAKLPAQEPQTPKRKLSTHKPSPEQSAKRSKRAKTVRTSPAPGDDVSNSGIADKQPQVQSELPAGKARPPPRRSTLDVNQKNLQRRFPECDNSEIVQALARFHNDVEGAITHLRKQFRDIEDHRTYLPDSRKKEATPSRVRQSIEGVQTPVSQEAVVVDVETSSNDSSTRGPPAAHEDGMSEGHAERRVFIFNVEAVVKGASRSLNFAELKALVINSLVKGGATVSIGDFDEKQTHMRSGYKIGCIQSPLGSNIIWAKDDDGKMSACQRCTTNRQLCIGKDEGQTFILRPLHPNLRDVDRDYMPKTAWKLPKDTEVPDTIIWGTAERNVHPYTKPASKNQPAHSEPTVAAADRNPTATETSLSTAAAISTPITTKTTTTNPDTTPSSAASSTASAPNASGPYTFNMAFMARPAALPAPAKYAELYALPLPAPVRDNVTAQLDRALHDRATLLSTRAPDPRKPCAFNDARGALLHADRGGAFACCPCCRARRVCMAQEGGQRLRLRPLHPELRYEMGQGRGGGGEGGDLRGSAEAWVLPERVQAGSSFKVMRADGTVLSLTSAALGLCVRSVPREER